MSAYQPESHPSSDTTGRFAVDQLLRKYGFVIFSRPVRGKIVWRYKGKLFTQQEAISFLDEDEVWAANYEEYCYYHTKGMMDIDEEWEPENAPRSEFS